MGKLLNPFIDFAFKYLFGREENKRFLIDFLNGLFEEDPNFEPIINITYLDKEKGKRERKERGVIYDIYCETSNGRRFVVEMQNSAQEYFFDRTIYYASKGIVEQAQVGKDWKFEYLPVYCISFMKFVNKEYKDSPIIDVGLYNRKTKELFSDRLRLIYIQAPLFSKKREEECKTDLEKWMYNIVNMENMETIAFTKEKILFAEFQEVASYANLNEEERAIYDADLKAYRDIKNQLEFAEAQAEARGISIGEARGISIGETRGISIGQAQGEAKERRTIVLNMKSQGMDAQTISKFTGIPLEDILTISRR